MHDSSFYKDREQTFVKHFVLTRYLEKLAYKIGFRFEGVLSYVDCFAGPWRQTAEDLSDCSPSIAIEELCKARNTLRSRHSKDFDIRCLFIEKSPESFTQLEEFLEQKKEAETAAIRGSFEDNIGRIRKWLAGGFAPGRSQFAFLFIDPTGWTGFSLDKIRPLLQFRPSEVLINFMTGHIIRFVDSERETDIASFKSLFGSESYRDAWRNKTGLDREEAVVNAYCERIKLAGDFEFVVPSIVLDPLRDRSHFHLIYATRSFIGLQTFRDEVERKSFPEQEKARFERWAREVQESTGQTTMFSVESSGGADAYLNALRNRYEREAFLLLDQRLAREREVGWDSLLKDALQLPLVNSFTMKQRVGKLREAGVVRLKGLKSRERVPKVGMGHSIVLISSS